MTIGIIPYSVSGKRILTSGRSKNIKETIQSTGITKCKKRLLFLKSAKYPLGDVGARKKTVTIIVSVTPVVAASLKSVSHFGIVKVFLFRIMYTKYTSAIIPAKTFESTVK